jgi:hypothetical protein
MRPGSARSSSRSSPKTESSSLNAADVVELIGLLEEHGIDVWLNGGWGVDALLGHQPVSTKTST